MRMLVASAFAAVVLLAAASAGATRDGPPRTVIGKAPVSALALTGATLAFGVGHTASDCDHVEVWNTATRALVRLGRRRPCGDLPLFSGIGRIGVASRRVVWVTYAGGNLTDWQVWTATTTARTPRRLAFVERDSSDAPAVTVGQGTASAVPYAVGNRLTLLRDDGTRAFLWTAPGEVRLTAAGPGPGGWRVVALLASGDVVVLDRNGTAAATFAYAPGVARWVALTEAGLLVQVGGARIELHRPAGGDTAPTDPAPAETVHLPANAIAAGATETQLLYRVGQRFRVRDLASGADTPVLAGSRRRPAIAALSPSGLAWASGSTVTWAGPVAPS